MECLFLRIGVSVLIQFYLCGMSIYFVWVLSDIESFFLLQMPYEFPACFSNIWSWVLDLVVFEIRRVKWSQKGPTCKMIMFDLCVFISCLRHASQTFLFEVFLTYLFNCCRSYRFFFRYEVPERDQFYFWFLWVKFNIGTYGKMNKIICLKNWPWFEHNLCMNIQTSL